MRWSLLILFQCSGPSMEPTLYSNNILVTEHISPRLDRIQRGDIVIAKCPTNPNQHICKRIVGLPGDKIRTGFTSQVIPRGHVWLEGDNRSNSSDSRTYGPVPKGLIRSRAIFKIWPPSDAAYLKDWTCIRYSTKIVNYYVTIYNLFFELLQYFSYIKTILFFRLLQVLPSAHILS